MEAKKKEGFHPFIIQNHYGFDALQTWRQDSNVVTGYTHIQLNGETEKYLVVCSTFQAHTICQLLCSGDRYHGNEFNISLLLLAYAYCSGLDYICA